MNSASADPIAAVRGSRAPQPMGYSTSQRIPPVFHLYYQVAGITAIYLGLGG
jgi:hypothetical protein